MKRLLALLLAVLLFLPEVALAAAGLENVDDITQAYIRALNEDIAEKTHGRVTDFYAVANKKGQLLRTGDLLLGAPDLEEFVGVFHYAVWGPWNSDPKWDGAGGIKYDLIFRLPRARYIGYSKYGEAIGNVFYPPDFPPKGQEKPYPFEALIERPWGDKSVRNAFPQFFVQAQNPINDALINYGYDPKSGLLERIQFGYYISALANGYDPFDLFDPKVLKHDAYNHPEKYIHIVLPPTDDTMGSGLVFHRSKSGGLYYMSVPIPNKPFMDQMPPFEFPEDAIEIAPKEQTGQTGTPVEFELKVNWDKIAFMQKFYSAFGYDLGFRVTLAHKTKSGSYPIDFKIDSIPSSKLTAQSYVDLLPATLGGELPTKYEATTTFKVTVQSAPTEVVAEIYPFLAAHGKKTPLVFASSNDSLYKTAKATVKPFMPDYAVQLTPSERTAKPGDEVNFNLTVSWKDHPAGQGFRVILAYQTPQGKLPVDFTLGGKTATKGRDVSYVSNMTNQPEGSLSGTVRVKAYDKTSTLIAQVIPLDRNGNPLPVQPPYDGDPKNNEAKAVVKPMGVDYAAVPFKEPVKLYIPYGVNHPSFRIIPHFERLDGIPVNVPYTITIRGAFGTVTKQGDNIPNHQSIGVPYPINDPPLGTYQVTAEIWPVQKDLDVNPANNRTVITVIVEKAPPPEKGPVQRGIHVELGS